jgi:acyl-CoA synthetase (NDP forming)
MKVLKEKDSEDFLQKRGFPIIERSVVNKYEEALKVSKKFGYPVVLKVINKLHKTDSKGVKLDVTENTLEKSFKNLKKKSRSVMVQKFIPGEEFILGLKRDEIFGHVLMFGGGGVFVEVMKDIAFRVCPVTLSDVRKMMQEVKAYKILQGARGRKLNIKALEKIMIQLSKLAVNNKDIEELDINPLIVNTKEAKIVDVRLVMK